MKKTIAWTIESFIKQYNSLSSGHFFDKDTMRFFKSRITGDYKRLNDKEALFITTEVKCANKCGPCADSIRKRAIRRAKLEIYICKSDGRQWERIDITTEGEFNKMSLDQAKRTMSKIER